MIEGRQARGRASEQRGRRGEVWAALLLTLKGYRILGKRVRTQLGEINLIARAAALYLAARPGLAKKGVRFDVVAVVPGRPPRHFRNAWRPDDLTGWRSDRIDLRG